jgi:hypothetical protein
VYANNISDRILVIKLLIVQQFKWDGVARISHQMIEQFVYYLYRQEPSEVQLSGYSINTFKVHPASNPMGRDKAAGA